MIRGRCLRAALLFVLLLGAHAVPAGAMQASVSPSAVKQGDAFFVIVTATPAPPDEAFFRDMNLPFSPCGEQCFVAVGAVGIKTAAGKYQVRVVSGDKTMRLPISVKKADFKAVHLTLPREKVELSPQDLERAEAEEKKLKTLWQKTSGRKWSGRFEMPLGNELSTQFGVTRIINRTKKSVHGGIDIRGREGEEVRAANRGEVVLSESLFFGGNTVIVDHGGGIYSVYMHLSRIDVETGEHVISGQVVGLVGSTGRSSGPHLHFGVKVLGTNADPRSLVRLKLP